MFTSLTNTQAANATFIARIPDPSLDFDCDRDEALVRLRHHHQAIIASLPWANGATLLTARQVHGATVATVTAHDAPRCPIPDCDALVTADPAALLGIYVADCCPVYLLDPHARVIGLVHSGRKGAELGIGPATVQHMTRNHGAQPHRTIAVLGPCIRLPHYEVDFPAQIRHDLLAAGLLPQNIHDQQICTHTHPDLYYSYRREKGRTGRMLALLRLL